MRHPARAYGHAIPLAVKCAARKLGVAMRTSGESKGERERERETRVARFIAQIPSVFVESPHARTSANSRDESPFRMSSALKIRGSDRGFRPPQARNSRSKFSVFIRRIVVRAYDGRRARWKVKNARKGKRSRLRAPTFLPS